MIIGFNHKYLAEILKHIKTDKVEILIGDCMKYAPNAIIIAPISQKRREILYFIDADKITRIG